MIFPSPTALFFTLLVGFSSSSSPLFTLAQQSTPASAAITGSTSNGNGNSVTSTSASINPTSPDGSKIYKVGDDIVATWSISPGAAASSPWKQTTISLMSGDNWSMVKVVGECGSVLSALCFLSFSCLLEILCIVCLSALCISLHSSLSSFRLLWLLSGFIFFLCLGVISFPPFSSSSSSSSRYICS